MQHELHVRSVWGLCPTDVWQPSATAKASVDLDASFLLGIFVCWVWSNDSKGCQLKVRHCCGVSQRRQTNRGRRHLQYKAALLGERIGGVALKVVNAECVQTWRQRDGARHVPEGVRSCAGAPGCQYPLMNRLL